MQVGDLVLRSLPDEVLDDPVVRLEAQVRSMSETRTALGRKLRDQYLGALSAARLERDRRGCH
jgi:hypothetical protein